MAFFIDGGLPRFREGFSKRVRALSQGDFRKIRASGFLALSALFGFWADQSLEISALKRFERENPPSSTLMQTLLKGYQMTRLQDSDQLQRVMKTIPTHMDQEGTIWISGDLGWVVYFLSWDQETQGLVFAAEPRSRHLTHWDRLGVGWKGLERLVERLDGERARKAAFDQSSAEKRIRRGYRDPREIVY